MKVGTFLTFSLLWVIPCISWADDPCKSGPQPTQRPGPYISIVSTGPNRGQSHCFICEAADKPTVIVFARNLSDPLGKLVHQLDKALADHKDLRTWVTFLAEDQPTMDPKVVAWGQKHATGAVPLGVYEDQTGPPAYLLHREADVTVLFSVKQRVAANFAFRQSEWNEAAVVEVLRALPQIVKAK